MRTLATLGSVLIIVGCHSISDEIQEPGFSASFVRTVSGYRFYIYNHSKTDLLVRYPFASIVFASNIDDYGDPVADSVEVQGTGDWCYYPLSQCEKRSRFRLPCQVLIKEVTFKEMLPDGMERNRNYRKIFLTIAAMPLRSDADSIAKWYKSHIYETVTVVPNDLASATNQINIVEKPESRAHHGVPGALFPPRE